MIFFLILNHLQVCLIVKCGNKTSSISGIICPLKFSSYESADEVRAWMVEDFHTYHFSTLAFLVLSYIQSALRYQKVPEREYSTEVQNLLHWFSSTVLSNSFHAFKTPTDSLAPGM